MSAQQILQQGGFLAASRQHPDWFSLPAHHTLSSGGQVIAHAAGIIEFEPAQATAKQAIVLSCGVHGNETAPIELLDNIVNELIKEKWQVAHPVLFLFGNLPAMDQHTRFIQENMNRLFNGAHSRLEGDMNDERHRAKQLEEAVSQFFARYPQALKKHYDLHTAIRSSAHPKFAVYPFLHGKPWNEQELAFLTHCGVDTVLLSNAPTSTFSYSSSVQHQAHAFTVELGKVKPFGQNDPADFVQVDRALRQLITDQLPALTYQQKENHLYRIHQVINKTQPDFTLHFADDAPNFTAFSQGELLASETGKQYVAEFDAEAIVFPNAKVALGQRALLTVVPTTLDSLRKGQA